MRVSLRAAVWAVVLAALVPLAPVRADEAAPGAPVLRESFESGFYRLQGSFFVGADLGTVWQVLTDFEGMPRFVASIRSSVPETLPDGGLLVAQEFEGKAFIFTRTLGVRLVVQEQPERRIVFHDVSLRDFDTYEGSWNIKASTGGTRVVYRLNAQPHESIPGFVGRGAFKDGTAEMLLQLQSEMARRSTPSSHSNVEQPSEGNAK